MDKRKTEIERFEQVIELLREEFPDLKIDLFRDHPEVEAAADIPIQEGITVPVSINLQNKDELHINFGEHFWVEWFPCGKEEVFHNYWDALRGIISGEYRLLETYAGNQAVSADIQRPTEGGWEYVVGWGHLRGCLPLPRLPRHQRVLQNPGVPMKRT